MQHADVVIIGGGVIGLCSAAAIAARQLSVTVVSESRPGEASTAAAGMLAPSVERADGPAHQFACAARDFYRDYLELIADKTGIRVPLNMLGILQVALSEAGVRGLQRSLQPGSEWVARAELARMEPTLGHALGAVLNPDDGAVDNTILMKALAELVLGSAGIDVISTGAIRVRPSEGTCIVELRNGKMLESAYVVLAPGAWGAFVEGAPALRFVTPGKGQLISFPVIGLRHVVYGPRGYLVPRSSGVTIAGSTMENAGFNASTTPEGIARIRSAAEEIAPALSVGSIRSAWAGLRPVTPDMLPLIGPDEQSPRLVYACGHGRNGILLAPLTAEVVARIVSGEPPGHDLSQYRPSRFND